MHINKFNIIFLAYFGMLTLTLIDTCTYANLRNFTEMQFNVYAVMTVIKIPCTYILKINKLYFMEIRYIFWHPLELVRDWSIDSRHAVPKSTDRECSFARVQYESTRGVGYVSFSTRNLPGRSVGRRSSSKLLLGKIASTSRVKMGLGHLLMVTLTLLCTGKTFCDFSIVFRVLFSELSLDFGEVPRNQFDLWVHKLTCVLYFVYIKHKRKKSKKE